MKKIAVILSVLILSGLYGCSALILKYDVVENYDKFNDKLDVYTKWNFTENNMPGARVAFNFHIVKVPEETVDYISILYTNDEWLFIERGQSLILLIDGDRVAVEGDGSLENREVVYAGIISEHAFYPVEKELMGKLTGASSVEYQIIGKYRVDGKLSTENIQRLRAFYKKYVE